MPTYIKGDATSPAGFGDKLIIHVCNNIGAWGAGFVLALDERFGTGEESPREQYLDWYNNRNDKFSTFQLGAVQVVKAGDRLYVGNMIAQNGVRTRSATNKQFVDYHAVRSCLVTVRIICKALGWSVHCPKFGAGLGGGDWMVIENLIIEELEQHGIPVTVYEFEG